MSANTFFLLTVSFLYILTDVAGRFIPDKLHVSTHNECSATSLRVRSLQSGNAPNRNKQINTNASIPEITTIRLQGDTDLGYYYVTLFFGTPVQKQTLIVDTGSITTTVPCNECGDNCGKDHFDKPFNQTQSSTFQKLECMEEYGNYVCTDCTSKCRFSVGYVEGSSYTGHFNKDYVVFGNEIEDYLIRVKDNQTNPRSGENITKLDKEKEYVDGVINKRKMFMPFGCTDKETKLFYTQEADGILGLGTATNTRSYPPNVLDALQILNANASREFSLCLAPSGGYFTLGGHNNAYHLDNHDITYTNYHDESGQYRVKLNKIKLEGVDIGVSVEDLNKGEGAFFDSGTTLTHVPKTTYNAITQSLSNFCSKKSTNCGGTGTFETKLCWEWNNSTFPNVADFFKTFPTFDWYFGDNGEGEYDWKPEDYLYKKSGNTYCMGLSKYERESILGGTFMKNHDVLFDKASKRLGFVRADCTAVNGITVPPEEKPTDKPSTPPEAEKPGDKVPEKPEVKGPENVDTPHEPSALPKSNTYKILIILASIAGLIVIASIVALAVRSFRRIRYSSMQNEIDLPDSKGFQLPSHIDASAVTNTDRSQDEDNPSKYQV